MKLPENKFGNLIRYSANKLLGKWKPVLRYGGFRLEVTSLMNLFGNRDVIRVAGTEYADLLLSREHFNRVLDIGANTGNLAFWLINNGLASKRTQFTAIEPDMATFQQLERNYKRNGLCNAELINAAAVNDARKCVTFQKSTVSNASGIHRKHDAPGLWATITVPAVDLRAIEPRFDLVSIDVEGGEFDLLQRPLAPAIARAKWVLAEYHEPLSTLVFVRTQMNETHNFVSYTSGGGGLGNALFRKRP